MAPNLSARSLIASALLSLGLLSAGAAPASAGVRTGEGADPSLDQATGTRDLTALRASYDTSGTLEAVATLREAPTLADSALLTVIVGTPRSDGACGVPFVLAGAVTDPADAAVGWVDSDAPSIVLSTGASKQTAGTTITLKVATTQLPATDFTCATAKLTKNGDTSTVFDATDTPVQLVGPTPVPTPAPTPTPTRAPAATPVPITPEQVAPPAAAPAKGSGKVELVAAAPSALVRGAWTKVPVRIANGTAKRLPKTVLVVGLPAGFTAKGLSRPVGALASGDAQTITLRLRPGSRAGSAPKLRLSLRKGKRTLARSTTKLSVLARGAKPPTTTTPPGPAAGPAKADPNDLTGRHYSRWTQDLIAGALVSGYYFASPQFVFKGVPEGGLPACPAASDTCLPYTYSAATNSLTINGQPATLTDDRGILTVDADKFPWNPIPPAGSRFALALTHTWAQGLWPYATSGHDYLSMSADGHFSVGATSIASLGAGTSVETFASTVAADQRGLYDILDGGRLQLRFDDGHVQVRTIAITRDTATGSADPAKDGLILDRDYYWVPSS